MANYERQAYRVWILEPSPDGEKWRVVEHHEQGDDAATGAASDAAFRKLAVIEQIFPPGDCFKESLVAEKLRWLADTIEADDASTP